MAAGNETGGEPLGTIMSINLTRTMRWRLGEVAHGKRVSVGEIVREACSEYLTRRKAPFPPDPEED